MSVVAVLGIAVAVGLAARQPDVAVRAGFRSASADAGSMVWERSAASGTTAQDATERARIRSALRGAPITIATSAVGPALPLTDGRGSVLPLRDDAALRDATSGLPALDAGEVAVDRAGAARLGLTIGDELEVSTPSGLRVLQVAAVWRERDARAPLWSGISSGAGGAAARVVLAPAELQADRVALTARWSIAPDVDRLRAGDLAALAAGYARLGAAPQRLSAFAELDGGGAGTVDALRRGAAAAAAVAPVPVALLGGGALLAILLVVRLLAELRADETVLLRARGASRGQLAAGDVRAALPPVLGGAVVGGAAAQLALLAVAPPTGWAEVALPVAVPVLAALVAVAVVSWTATADRAHARAARVGGAAGAALLGVIAAIGVVRLVGAGAGADPAADLAPALLLAALVVAGLLAAPSVARAADRAARRSDGVAAPLTARRLVRRPGLVAGALVLVALAAGASGFAATAVPSSSGFLRDAGRLVTGGDLDVHVAGDNAVVEAGSEADPARVARVARADASAPALVAPVRLGAVAATLAAAPSARLAGLQDGGVADLSALAPTVAPLGGMALRSSGTLHVGVEARAAAAPPDARVGLTAWVALAAGGLARVELPPVPVDGSDVDAATALPSGAIRLVALEAAVRGASPVTGLAVAVRTVRRGDASLQPGSAWSAATAPTAPGVAAGSGGALTWSAAGTLDPAGDALPLGRLVASGPDSVPVALSRHLATATGLVLGARADVDAGGIDIPIRVVALVPHTVAAADVDGVWADLTSLQSVLLARDADVPAAGHVWLASDDPEGAVDALAAAEPAWTVTASPLVAFAPLGRAAAVGLVAAAVGTLLFALLAIGTAVASLLRTRRAEVAVLRALGAGARVQGRAARLELGAVLGYGVVVGALTALVTGVVAVPAIAHATAAGIAPDVAVPVAVDPVVLGAAAAVLVLGVVGGIAALARGVARAAGRPGAEAER